MSQNKKDEEHMSKEQKQSKQEAAVDVEQNGMSRSELRAFAGFGLFLVFMTWGFLLFPDNHLYGLLFIPALIGLCLILFAGQ